MGGVGWLEFDLGVVGGNCGCLDEVRRLCGGEGGGYDGMGVWFAWGEFW